MGKLSTHVLDTTRGKPASNLEIKLYQRVNDKFLLVKELKTNSDGRCDKALLDEKNIEKGAYELFFNVEPYFHKNGIDSPFLKEVVIRFYIENEDENYHVPLLISPYGYSTYRGS